MLYLDIFYIFFYINFSCLLNPFLRIFLNCNCIENGFHPFILAIDMVSSVFYPFDQSLYDLAMRPVQHYNVHHYTFI